MKKILFLIPNLSRGGAEKVLVNLVNHMDKSKFDITVQVLFAGGVNEQFLNDDIKYKYCYKKTFRGNSHFFKLFSPKHLYKKFIKEHYDIIVSYLEGPTARIVSGCTDKNTKLVSWIHVEQHTKKKLASSFRSYREAKECYNRYDNTICVSQFVYDDFCSILNFEKPIRVLYNTVESDVIRAGGCEIPEKLIDDGRIRMVVVGSLKHSKGYGRLLSIINRLNRENYPIHLYILGTGPMQSEIEKYVSYYNMEEFVTLLGYQINPYKYISNCDLLICASFAEGFSTAVTEALILGTPVCTVDVSGMKELLGENNEYGVVTENSEQALYEGIKGLLDDRNLLNHYAMQSAVRGNKFQTESTVTAVEKMLLEVCGGK